MARRSLLSFWRSGRRLLRLTVKLAAQRPAAVPQPRPRAARPKADAPVANPGALEQRLYLPPRLKPRAPLVVLLHGCGQEPEALAEQAGWLALADRLGFVLLMPRQRAENNSQRCFSWYQANDTRRDHGEVASIHAMVIDTLARHRGDPGRVFAVGLSAGAAMVACLLAAYPESFAAGATMAGLPAGCATGVVAAMSRMAGHGRALSRDDLLTRARALGAPQPSPRWPRLQVWHGLADAVVAPGNADELAAQWCALHHLAGAGRLTAAPDGWLRTDWRDAAGAVAVERVLVDGVGHTSPAAWAAEVARFWGIGK